MKDKINKYIENLASIIGESKSKRSTYYQIGDKVLRVSDHIGKNSDGVFQIIIRPNGYLIYHTGTGIINICNYRQVQEFVRTFMLFPITQFPAQNLIVCKENEDTVMGVPLGAFSDGQIKAIKDMVKKVKNS